ncbi:MULTISPECIES: DUF6895 family protein [Streptomyces]|uniref:DUF6895 domain-containing protein n=1 Tax=Streptomyces venezuelae (strain ATCC 10712 / CBS 650.69 / DSM 40230 / JCM 4526 / NBRC 13096 / PD 04745) TaxID=953739 RepID=F2R7D5_STRVP|nr:hypothetical protein [Streptomyces venezuelae]APE19994.1 hypothetical protein vnz_02575 [Streptomyces venezuelae]QER97397.1 hypothetical protein DEJ43_02600 [Streptomyces venezuelae ATCC 10712]CCA53827.1 hypothetical protein SVEN_0540 [Streptomyces venezuelae ATCC 10712]
MPSPLEQLSARALDWLGAHLDFFDPFSSSGRSAPHGKAKAALELALLCHRAARPDAGPDPLGGATALVRKLWQDPDFPGLFDELPAYASTYGLIYAALAPDGIDDTLCRDRLALLPPEFLAPEGKSPYQRVEIRYYAEKAGVRHGIEPYAALVPQSPLVAFRAAGSGAAHTEAGSRGGAPGPDDGAPLATPRAYALTHTAFYLGDFGRTDPRLDADTLERARELVRVTLLHCVEHDRWDLAAELVLAQFILGTDPLSTPSGAAAVDCLLRAQRSDGAIPGRSAELEAPPSASAGEFFGKAYHTTLVTALMASIVASPRPS